MVKTARIRSRQLCFPVALLQIVFLQILCRRRIHVESFGSRPSSKVRPDIALTTGSFVANAAKSMAIASSTTNDETYHYEEEVYYEDDYDDGILEEEVSYRTSAGEKESLVDEDDMDDDERFDDKRTTSTAPLTMSEEQKQAMEFIRQGHNVFLTGVAGTGKSLVLRSALDYFSNNLRANQFVAVAPTGAAAVAVEGQTIHSFASIGIPKTFKDFEKSKRNKATAKHWRSLKVLVIDEISMVSGEFFDNLSAVVSDIRKDPRPFGGIQLVVCGDFLQLSPIAPRKEEVSQLVHAMTEGQRDPEEEKQILDTLFLNRGFAFQSLAWKEARFKVMELQTVFRQRNREFVDALRDIRLGRVTLQTMEYLRNNCERPLPPIDQYGIRPTILHSTNVNVNRENLVDLNRLPGETVVYKAMDEVAVEKGVGKWALKPLENSQFFKTCIAEGELQLKVNAQVMLIKNLNQGSRLVNGSRGTVVGFRSIKANPNSQKAETLHLLPGVDKYPVVQFVNGLRQVITPQKFQSRIVGMGTCTRTAVPLKLAWAITTHKAQGLTLDYVIADVGQVFAEAQLYVALSRASDAQGLELRNFSRNRVRANPIAMKFYEDPTQEVSFWWEQDGRARSDLPPSIMTQATELRQPKSRTKKKVKMKVKKERVVDSDDTLRTNVSTRPSTSVRGKVSEESSMLPSSSNRLDGKVFVFIGVLDTISNEDAEASVLRHGGVVRKSVSSKTDFVVLGEFLKNGKPSRSGAQFRKAKEIIEEQKKMTSTNQKFTGLRVLKEESFVKVLFK